MNATMLSNFTRFTVLASLMALGACSKPTDAVIPSDTAAWDKDLAPQVQKLSEDDRKLLTAYLTRVKMGEVFNGKGVPLGTTVGQALQEQKVWAADQRQKEAEEAALKAKMEAQRNAAIEQLNKVVTVTLLGKEQQPADADAHRYSETQVFRIGVRNNSDKSIAGVAGELKFIDIFDKEVGAVTFRLSETIAPGASVTWIGSRDYNQFIETHRAVWNLEEGKYKTRFIPDTVVFADGTKLGTPS